MKNIMKKVLVITTLFLVLGVFVGGQGYAREIKITDYKGVTTTIELPVKRIVCLGASLNQILYALDAGDKIVGRSKQLDKNKYPEELLKVPTVGDSSASPQLEAIIMKNPDLVIAGSMFDEEPRKKLNNLGIPVIVERASERKRLFTVIKNLSLLVDNEAKGEELISFIKKYEKIINYRLENLKDEERTSVFWEFSKPYLTGSRGSMVQPRIEMTGGKNIAAEAKGKYPSLSSEYVWEKNPEVIIRVESRGASKATLKKTYNNVISRSALKETSAVKNNRVHVITWEVQNGLPSVVGSLYYAKWFHPARFSDIDPHAVYEEMLSKFFGVKSYSKCVYPQ